MKKCIYYVSSFALILCGLLWSCSDSDPFASTESIIFKEFLESDYGVKTLENHGLTVTNLDLKKTVSTFIKNKGVTAFVIPIMENGRIIGRLNSFIVPGDDPYRAIVEKWEKSSENEYSVNITTGYGAYLATVAVCKDGRKTIQKIHDIASNKDMEIDLKTRSMEVEESWWECTTRVYHAAKEACSGDNECDFLCDLVNMVEGCTISIAAAAAIVCL